MTDLDRSLPPKRRSISLKPLDRGGLGQRQAPVFRTKSPLLGKQTAQLLYNKRTITDRPSRMGLCFPEIGELRPWDLQEDGGWDYGLP